MKYLNYIKIIVVCLMLASTPDFILSLAGRNTYMFHIFPSFKAIGSVCLVIFCFMVLIKLFQIVIEKKWIYVVSIVFLIVIAVLAIKETVIVLEKKSVEDSRIKVVALLESKGALYDFTIEIEDDARNMYAVYMEREFNPNEISLVWKVPRFGIYEYHVEAPGNGSFLLRHYATQEGRDRVWVHAGAKGSVP